MHLRDAHLGGDLGLRHVREEPQQDDLALALLQLTQQRPERLRFSTHSSAACASPAAVWGATAAVPGSSSSASSDTVVYACEDSIASRTSSS